jgi:xylulokinase
VIDPASGDIIAEESIVYDEYFSGYGITNGVIRGKEGEVHSSPLMWADALDLLFQTMKDKAVPFAEIKAVSGSGQQHGSVYLNETASDVLTGLDPGQSLAEQMKGIFSRETSPVWMDSSTEKECEDIEQAVWGRENLIRITGSAAFRRFTGPQIRKFFRREPEQYDNTVLIQLVSSYMASVLAGKPVPIEPGDGAGMNLMDIQAKAWSPQALEATAPDLIQKLLPIVPSDTVAGKIHPYFVNKYGFSEETDVVVFSGDNPCSIIGVGLVEPGMAAVSLGTSDTMFTYMKELRTSEKGEGVVFGAPTGDYMSLICMRNGSLARERVRDMFSLDWESFSECLRKTDPGNQNKVMLPYFEQEIYPPLEGVRRFDLREDERCENVRAVIEAQAMGLKVHSEWMGVETESICMTGGASVNREILQIFANVYQAKVYRFETPNSASLGAALRALYSFMQSQGEDISWKEAVEPFTRPVPGSEVEPDESVKRFYDIFRERFIQCEEQALAT